MTPASELALVTIKTGKSEWLSGLLTVTIAVRNAPDVVASVTRYADM